MKESMKEIVGKWFLDVAKYIATALIISFALAVQTDDTVFYYSVCFGLFAVILVCGLILLNSAKKNANMPAKRRKK
jgi:hypothetical protein